ncbi:hypothetical protein MBLNU230_g0893t1 [Neophaeotheca triangularis]
MSRRALTLPLRTLTAQSQAAQWTCKRCLATQTSPSITDSTPDPPAPNFGTPTWHSQNDHKPLIERELPHNIPLQLLKHTTTPLPPHEATLRQKAQSQAKASRKVIGVVTSVGRMAKTVKVRIPSQRYEPRVQKYFADHKDYLVHDPNESLVEGDTVELHRLKVSSAVDYIVAGIVAPFGKPVDQRPPLQTPDERLEAYKAKRFAKLERRGLRLRAAKGDAEAIQGLRAMGLDPGAGVGEGIGEATWTQRTAGKFRNTGNPALPGKGAIRGEKGQKLPQGVLPGGKHEVGKIDERAKRNKESAMGLDEKAQRNLQAAKVKGDRLKRQGLGSDSVQGKE